jgi:hypothetical protein
MLKEFIDIDNQWQQALQAVYHHFPVTSSSPGCMQSITSYRHNGVKFFVEECTVVLGSRKPDDRWANYRVPAEFSSFQAVTCHSSKEKNYVILHFHLCLDRPSDLSLPGSPIIMLYRFPIPSYLLSAPHALFSVVLLVPFDAEAQIYEASRCVVLSPS